MKDEDILNNDIRENTLTFYWDFGDNVHIPDGFVEWFFKTSVHLGKIVDLPNDLHVAQNTPSQCFHNSALISLNNSSIKYFEGLLYGPKFKNCIHHGFNVCDKGVIDITYLNNRADFHNDSMRDEYYIYYGVHIPFEFIKDIKEKLNNNHNQHTPLLLNYYNSLQK
ncbi:MAG: hypothetical protein JST26_04515 [Bacteroidetes bacterium]|nr:hypothetical protein [Bacteroidota bacterium]